MEIELLSKVTTTSSFDTWVIPVLKSSEFSLPVQLREKFNAEQLKKDFEGEKDEIFWIYSSDLNHKICFLGLGENPDFKRTQSIVRGFRVKQKKKLNQKTAILFTKDLDPLIVEAISNGYSQGSYNVGIFKSDNHVENTEKVTFISEGSEVQNSAIRRGKSFADTQCALFDIVNAPSNKKGPGELADWCKKSAEKYHYSCRVLDKKELEEQGMHALLAVNRGSEIEAKFIILEYTPESYEKTIALVGKGITFDTGGLSIKGHNNMHYMKSDMGGAAAVMGALEMAAKEKLTSRIIGIIPTTDNSVDALAIKPGDVIDSYSGKTIEVINTDAEGRLVLADGLSYAVKTYKPDYLIDLATLTGSVIRALGVEAAGLFSNNDALANAFDTAGQDVGEKVWRLPIWDEYMDSMQSDIADIRNLSDKPYAGAITAAKFLEAFIDDHPAWAHLDIAGVAFGPSSLSKSYSASGYGVRLLIETISRLS